MLSRQDSRITFWLLFNLTRLRLNFNFILWWVTDLAKHHWLLLLNWSSNRHQFIEPSIQMLVQVVAGASQELRKIRHGLTHHVADGMQFVPEITLDFWEVRPGIHTISFNVLYLLLSSLLLGIVTLNVLDIIRLFRRLYDDVSYLLWRLNLLDDGILLKPLSNDLTDWHVVNFLRSLNLRKGDFSRQLFVHGC